MTRGTTPTHIIETDISLADVEALYITYSQRDKVIIEKSLEDVEINGHLINIKLTQEDTLSFNDADEVLIQIRARLSDGTAVASNLMRTDVKKILKDGEI